MCTTSHKEKYTRKDGSIYEKDTVKYLCYHRSRKLNDYNGASTYKAEVVDAAIIEAIRKIFANIKGCPHEEKIQSAYRKMMTSNRQNQKKLTEQVAKDNKQLDKLRMEIANALAGTSIYSSEDLAQAIQTIRNRIEESEKQLEALKREEVEQKATSETIIPAYNQFKSWAHTFETASFEYKKMIANQLFTKVEIGVGYKIHLEMDATYQAFCDEWLMLETNNTDEITA